MRLFIVRHGETEENIKGIIIGHLQGELSEKGKVQAKELAESLSNEKIDIIYSSDLKRAKDTTVEIAKLKNCEVVFTEDLREREYGEIQGKTKSELGVEKSTSAMSLDFEGGETVQDIFDRAKNFLVSLVGKHGDDESILFSAHNGINKALLAVINGESPESIKNPVITSNGTYVIVEINKEEFLKNLEGGGK